MAVQGDAVPGRARLGAARSDVATVLETTLKHTGRFSTEFAGYVNAGNLDAAKMPAGTMRVVPEGRP